MVGRKGEKDRMESGSVIYRRGQTMVSRLGFEPRTLALKGPQASSKINVLCTDIFQSDTWFYNGLQIGCPI